MADDELSQNDDDAPVLRAVPGSAGGYRLVLPPGWLRLDARADAGRARLDAELDRVLPKTYQPTLAPVVAQARAQAHSALHQAREAGAIDLYLPLGGVRGIPIPASFLVTVRRFAAAPPPTLAAQGQEALAVALIANLAATMPDAQTRMMAAGPAVRSTRPVVGAASETAPAMNGGRVDYIWPVPGDAALWVMASFTTMRTPELPASITDQLVALFDAIMSTWRWDPGLVL